MTNFRLPRKRGFEFGAQGAIVGVLVVRRDTEEGSHFRRRHQKLASLHSGDERLSARPLTFPRALALLLPLPLLLLQFLQLGVQNLVEILRGQRHARLDSRHRTATVLTPASRLPSQRIRLQPRSGQMIVRSADSPSMVERRIAARLPLTISRSPPRLVLALVHERQIRIQPILLKDRERGLSTLEPERIPVGGWRQR